MTERTDQLVVELARGLRAVRRLPPLGRVAAGIVGAAAALVLAELWYAWATGSPIRKADFGPIDAETIATHALLGAAALAFALGACVPGRERLARAGASALGLAIAATFWVGCERLAHWPGPQALEPGWLGAALACWLGAVAPALLPALLVARFGARAAPRRAALVLLVGAAAAIGMLTLPGILRCAEPDELHQVVAHLLAPALGALVLLAVALPVYRSARASIRS